MICCVGTRDTNTVAAGRDPVRSDEIVRHLRQVGDGDDQAHPDHRDRYLRVLDLTERLPEPRLHPLGGGELGDGHQLALRKLVVR